MMLSSQRFITITVHLEIQSKTALSDAIRTLVLKSKARGTHVATLAKKLIVT